MDKKLDAPVLKKPRIIGSSGTGRPKGVYEVSASRQHYYCPVSKECRQGKGFRSDKLREHYFNKVIFDNAGQPVKCTSPQYLTATKNKTESTKFNIQLQQKFFSKNGYHKNKLPPNITHANAAKNPFEMCKSSIAKRKIDEPASSSASAVEANDNDENDNDNLNAIDEVPEAEYDICVDDDKIDQLNSQENLSNTAVAAQSTQKVNITQVSRDELVQNIDSCNLEKNDVVVKLDKDDVYKIADQIAIQLHKINLEEEVTNEKKEGSKIQQILPQLKETENEYICLCCLNHSQDENVPHNIRSSRKASFGFFKKLNSTHERLPRK